MVHHLKPCPFCGCEKILDGFIRDGREIFCGECRASVTAYHPDASKRAAERWNRRQEAAEPIGVRCTGCGSSWDDDRLAEEKSKRPGVLSCCPERKMIPVYAALPAPSAAVKALGWFDGKCDGPDCEAKTAFGKYRVFYRKGGQWEWSFSSNVDDDEMNPNFPHGKSISCDEAKDAAQADYEARVRSALSAQVQHVAGSGGMEFPEALTDDLLDVLSTMIWTSGQIAACLRAGGDQIKTRAEDEQAHVLHWLISLALKHGPEWRAKASERIEAIRDAAAPAKQEG